MWIGQQDDIDDDNSAQSATLTANLFPVFFSITACTCDLAPCPNISSVSSYLSEYKK